MLLVLAYFIIDDTRQILALRRKEREAAVWRAIQSATGVSQRGECRGHVGGLGGGRGEDVGECSSGAVGG